jgi:hypothetical protein
MQCLNTSQSTGQQQDQQSVAKNELDAMASQAPNNNIEQAEADVSWRECSKDPNN